MLRGVRKAWKFPLMYEFDMNMELEEMKNIISVIESCGGRVRYCTGDMGNKTFLSEVGVTKGNYSFPNPARPEAKIHVFCDAPHLIKVGVFFGSDMSSRCHNVCVSVRLSVTKCSLFIFLAQIFKHSFS